MFLIRNEVVRQKREKVQISVYCFGISSLNDNDKVHTATLGEMNIIWYSLILLHVLNMQTMWPRKVPNLQIQLITEMGQK